MPRFHGSVCRKHAAAPYDFDVRFDRHCVFAKLERLLEQGQREEGGVSFIHVVTVGIKADGCEVDSRLPSPAILPGRFGSADRRRRDVSERVRSHSRVLRQVGIQQIHGDNEPGHAMDVVSPGPNGNVTILDLDREGRFDGMEDGWPDPTDRVLRSDFLRRPDAAGNSPCGAPASRPPSAIRGPPRTAAYRRPEFPSPRHRWESKGPARFPWKNTRSCWITFSPPPCRDHSTEGSSGPAGDCRIGFQLITPFHLETRPENNRDPAYNILTGSKRSPHPILAGSKSPTRHSALATAR